MPETARLLHHSLPVIESRIIGAEALLIQLDFDGTLAPIVPTPDEARMPEATRELLAELAAQPGITVVILSGRSLADVREKTKVPNVVYGGNHGMEIWHEDGLAFTEIAAEAARLDLQRVTAALANALRHIEGAQVEDKGLTSSIHYPPDDDARRDEIIEAVEGAVAKEGGRLRLTRGSLVVEIRPAVEWNKGTAALWIQKQLGGAALSMYIGDDTTDEDAFAALSDGITIRVGCGTITSAKYCIPFVEEVPAFLRWVASTFRRKPTDG